MIEAAPLTLTLTLTLTLALALTLTLTLGLPEELVGAELEAFEGQSPHEGRCHSCVQTQHALLARVRVRIRVTVKVRVRVRVKVRVGVGVRVRVRPSTPSWLRTWRSELVSVR